MAGAGEAWYTVAFANSGTSYHLHVYRSSGFAYYEIDVFPVHASS